MKYILEVSRYLDNDVIATSGHYSIDGMSEDSYQLYVDVASDDVCGWYLTGGQVWNNIFTYYDQSGKIKDSNLRINGWVDKNIVNSDTPTGKWFHYYEDENKNEYYIYCNDESHHHK